MVDTVQLYMLGLMDINTAIGRLAQHQPNNQSYQNIANKSPEYDSLQAAYDAYVKKITEDDNYLDFKDTLPHN